MIYRNEIYNNIDDDFPLKADLVDSSHSNNTAMDNDLSIAIDGCDNGKKLTLDLQSQIDELNDKLNNVISTLDNFNKNIDDVKKEIASEADNDILYSNVYEYCLKIIENKFA